MRNETIISALDRPKFWSRSQAATYLGISGTAVAYADKLGTLRPAGRTAEGHWLYDPQVVRDHGVRRRKKKQTEAKRAGALHAAVFARLKAGESARDIVIALAQPFEVVEELVRKYAAAGEAIVPAPIVTELGRILGEAGYGLDWRELPGLVEHWIAIERAENKRQLATARGAKGLARAPRNRQSETRARRATARKRAQGS